MRHETDVEAKMLEMLLTCIRHKDNEGAVSLLRNYPSLFSRDEYAAFLYACNTGCEYVARFMIPNAKFYGTTSSGFRVFGANFMDGPHVIIGGRRYSLKDMTNELNGETLLFAYLVWNDYKQFIRY